ncbi:23S rRNA (uracil(1939)-C(5))-methyltransferase RlmD [Candidatus Peregrinibacteria bacterium]|jgi:23S rRNA (uracil1939-C5)-methyltransferase|nr:23S rRNA (uracil(1939)-C(5))-methyltransferase RlmD [Candidatus Peregrinibacteria bacterium]MBT7736318.1 23S rRNA (uracil(1939)-C(5))-methyltransferase RlmD [Candidatus Peregrinibacteria bacterium]
MQLKKGEIIEFDVHAMAFGGSGIGKYEGMTVFVDKAMPGDRVKAALTRIKPKFAESKFVEIVKPSPDRVEPKCKYSGKCGGCQLQFMPYKKQVEFKQQNVIDSFERIGKIFDANVLDVIECKEPFYYRNKMEFSFGYDADMQFTLGMHVPGRRFDILDLTECHLESKLSTDILNITRAFMRESEWKPFKYSIGKGFLRALYIREGKRTGEVLVNLVTSDDVPKNFDEEIKKYVDKVSTMSDGDQKVTSIYWTTIISKRGQRRQTKEKVLFGKRFLTEKMILENGDELSFDILPQAFFQVNTYQAELLYQEVLKLATQSTNGTVFDLFCGTGTIGLFLAKHCEKVLGIELNEEAVKAARENAQKNNIFNIDFYVGDATKMLGDIKEFPSLIVVDPPRAGLTENMIKHMNSFNADRIIYVSCNPSTLARDCAWLKEYGYKVKSVQPVDMFPHTYHIENVCLLERD